MGIFVSTLTRHPNNGQTVERELVEGGVKDGRPAEDTRPAPDDPVVEKVTMRQNISGINK